VLAIAYGTLPNWLTFALLVAGALALSRRLEKGQAGAALEILQHANEVLEAEVARLRLRVAELERTHTLAPLIAALELHEAGAARRNAAVLDVLEQIAQTNRSVRPAAASG
jgi:hypothetical protein